MPAMAGFVGRFGPYGGRSSFSSSGIITDPDNGASLTDPDTGLPISDPDSSGTADGQYYTDDAQGNEFFSDDSQTIPFKTKD